MGLHSGDSRQVQEEKKTIMPLFNLEELLNRGHYIDALKDRQLAEAAHDAGRHLEMLVCKIKELNQRQLSRSDNYQWNDRKCYDKLLGESPVGYIIHERLPSFSVDDVLYRFDIIQLPDGVALRVVQDVAGTVKERKKKYFERYEGLVLEEQEEQMTDLLRELLSNLRKDLQSDITAALDKVTAPKSEEKSTDPFAQPQGRYHPACAGSLKIPSFYDSVIFMGMLSQRCAARLHPQLGLLLPL